VFYLLKKREQEEKSTKKLRESAIRLEERKKIKSKMENSDTQEPSRRQRNNILRLINDHCSCFTIFYLHFYIYYYY
jgi:hypothetical protein